VKKISYAIWSFSILVLSALTLFSLSPKNIFKNTLTTGGDTGAHVWWSEFFSSELLPKFKLFGWSMDYFSGFPAGQFYFPIPALMVTALDIVLPQNIAFKIVTIIGSIMLPVAAVYMVKSLSDTKILSPNLAGLAGGLAVFVVQFFSGDPRAETVTNSFFKLAGLDYQNVTFNQRIMGGNLPSALAGEFSFTISIVFLFFAIGALIKYFKGEKKLYLPVIFGALTIASHLVVGVVLIFISFTAFLIYYHSKKKDFSSLLLTLYLAFILSLPGTFSLVLDGKITIPNFVAISPVFIMSLLLFFNYKDKIIQKYFFFITLSFSLVAWWFLPLLTHFKYTSSMRYEKIQDIAATPINELYELYLFPRYAWWVGLGIALFALSGIIFYLQNKKSVLNVFPQYKYLLSFTMVCMALFVSWPESHAWNIRFLPFYYFFAVMLAFTGYGFVAEYSLNKALGFLSKLKRKYFSVAIISILATVLCVMFVFGVTISSTVEKTSVTKTDIISRLFKDRRGISPEWAEWNYEGYENKPSWREFQSIMTTLDTLPQGRLLWERVTSLNNYGSDIALDLIPYFTNGKIASSEGLYFEASGTTAYHFLTASYVSKEPSNPMRWPVCGLDEIKDRVKQCYQVLYGNNSSQVDFDLGVKKMQQLGINYYMATSDEMNNFASASSNLKLLKKISDKDGADPQGWSVYAVKNADIIEGVEYKPLIVNNADSAKDWTQTGNTWLVNLFNQNILAVSDTKNIPNKTHKSWQRINTNKARIIKNYDKQKLPEIKISKVKIENEKISFRVSKVGVPVLIKISYYPDWVSYGASQPTRVSPNHMLVVPTSKDVVLEFQRSPSEKIGILVSLSALVILIAFSLSPKYSQWSNTDKNKKLR
jgi:hypothetical protein